MPRFDATDSLLGEADDSTFVVALEDLPLVLESENAILRAPVKRAEEDPVLGLALVELFDADEAAARISERPARRAVVAQMRTERAEAHLPPPSSIDIILDDVRKNSAARFAGWTPLVGQNRLMRNVAGLPHVSGGGSGYPTPADPPPDRRPLDSAMGRPDIDAGLLTGPVVGLLDTAMVPHADLAGRYLIDPTGIWRERPHRLPNQWVGHAVFNAGIIAKQAPTARLMLSAVLDERAVASCWTVAREMVRLARSGVDVLCSPLGCFTFDGQPPLLLTRAASMLGNTVLVAAAGNHWTEIDEPGTALPRKSPSYPAALDTAVAVAASGSDPDGYAPFSLRRLPWIDFAAPGEDVVSTFLSGEVDIVRKPEDVVERRDFGSGYAAWGGTSMAAAYVSGRIAARMARRGDTARQAVDQLHAHTDVTVLSVRGRGCATTR